MRIQPTLLLGIAVMLAGCRSGILPDPNDAKQVGPLSFDTLYGHFKEIGWMLYGRQASGRITMREYRTLMRSTANDLLAGLDPDRVDVSKQWQLADLLVNAGRWDDAKRVLAVSIEWAKANHNDDRRVNDSLTLAQVLAEMGDVPGALKMARSTFDVAPGGAAPILYGVLYNVAPAARGKGLDVELAQLVEDAITIDMHVVVDPKTQPGQTFLLYRPAHIRRARRLVEELYEGANRPDLAGKAQQADKATTGQAQPRVRV